MTISVETTGYQITKEDKTFIGWHILVAVIAIVWFVSPWLVRWSNATITTLMVNSMLRLNDWAMGLRMIGGINRSTAADEGAELAKRRRHTVPAA